MAALTEQEKTLLDILLAWAHVSMWQHVRQHVPIAWLLHGLAVSTGLTLSRPGFQGHPDFAWHEISPETGREAGGISV